MPLNHALIQKIAGIAKKAVIGLTVEVLLKNPLVENYDPENAAFTRTFTESSIRGILGEYTQTEINDINVKVGDRRLLLFYPLPTVTQESRVVVQGREFHVITLKSDASQSTLVVQLRE